MGVIVDHPPASELIHAAFEGLAQLGEYAHQLICLRGGADRVAAPGQLFEVIHCLSGDLGSGDGARHRPRLGA